jgi:class 3 adenylate cyclase
LYTMDEAAGPIQPDIVPPKATLLTKVKYLLMDLQVMTPLLLIGFAAATIVFIVMDSVRYSNAKTTDEELSAMALVAETTVTIQLGLSDSPNGYDVRPALHRLFSNKHVNHYHSNLVAASDYFLNGDAPSGLASLGSIQTALVESVLEGDNELGAAPSMIYGQLLASFLSVQRSVDLMKTSEGTMTSSRALLAASTNVLCNPIVSSTFAAIHPQVSTLSSLCDTGAVTALTSASSVNTSLAPLHFSHLLEELDMVFAASSNALAREVHLTGGKLLEYFPKRIAVLSVALFIALAGAIGTSLLVLTQHHSLEEQSVVEADFDCNARRVKIRIETLSIVDEIASKIGVMGDCEDGWQTPNQIELHLRRALKPLQLLRPFVPTYMYLRSLRSMSVRNQHTSALFRNTEMLNLGSGLVKKPATILFVGLRRFNADNADMELLNELLAAVRLACSHFQGNIVQVASDGVLAMFSRATLNEDEGDERVEDGEVLAVHAAFAIQEICNAPIANLDGKRREPFNASMAVAHGISFQGLTQFHVTKQLALMSPAVSAALEMEPLNAMFGSHVLTTTATSDIISGHFITRPVNYLPGVGSIFHVIEEDKSNDEEADPNVVREQTKLKEKTRAWCKAWEKYEALVSNDKPSYELLEDAYRDMEGYKVFHMGANEKDIAFDMATAHIKKVAQHLGVSLGATMEEE